MKEQWRYYNHALIPNTSPHESVDVVSLKNTNIWNDRRVLLARWTTEYDSEWETNWWYCIKDEPFDINNINAKRRYEINKGKKNFRVKLINPSEHKESLYNVFVKANETYTNAAGYDKKNVLGTFEPGLNKTFFGAYCIEDNSLCGYAILQERGEHIDYVTHKSIPAYEARGVNAAIVNAILEYYSEKLRSGIYICDGERNIYHETGFQGYLEKYFGFRKAYCKLNIKYKPMVKVAVNILYPFRTLVCKFPFLAKVGAVLKMHELHKKQKRKKNSE